VFCQLIINEWKVTLIGFEKGFLGPPADRSLVTAHHRAAGEEDDCQAIVLGTVANAVAFEPANVRPG